MKLTKTICRLAEQLEDKRLMGKNLNRRERRFLSKVQKQLEKEAEKYEY